MVLFMGNTLLDYLLMSLVEKVVHMEGAIKF